MGLISLQTLYDTWKAVSDWVIGGSQSKPKITVEPLGATNDVESVGDGTLIAIVKRIRTMITNVWDEARGVLRVNTREGISSAIVVGEKSVTTVAVNLCAGATPLASRREMELHVCGTDVLYLGPSSVTTATGMPVLPGEKVRIKFDPYSVTEIYGVTDSSVTVRIKEVA